MPWTARDIPDQHSKTAIVTGANSGLGLETVRALAQHGAQVVLACRNLERAQAARMDLLASTPQAKLEIIPLDLASLKSVRQFVTEFSARHATLDILVNNAGIMMPPPSRTEDGFELQFGANHLGHFALTGLLLPALMASPGARVVIVASATERWGRIDFEHLNADSPYDPSAAYAQSKLANLLFCLELGRRLERNGLGMVAAAAHPGWTASNLQRNAPAIRFLNRFLAQSPAQGAWPSLYAATAADVQNGEYFGPGGPLELRGSPKRVQASPTARDPVLAQRLWEVSEQLSGVSFSALA